MSTAIKRRRGTTTEHTTFTGLEGELTVDTTKDTVVVHDGTTVGGVPLLRQDLSNNTAVVTASGTQTLTNKTISLTSNTLSATSAEVAAAVSDETGTGALVFATSPTLVTPVLGTPQSGTLTNATGLPLSTGVTGTLAVANGGTGLATLTANNVVVGNGTSTPLFVAPGTSGNVLTSNGTTWTSAAGSSDKIEEGDSKVEVTDTGTGKVEITVDAVEVADFTTGAIVFNETGANQDFRVEGDSNANLIVADAGVDKVGIGTNTFNTNGGVLQVSNGISFPATQSALSDANTLDDYEEGTWTPVVSPGSGGTITSLTVAGRYTKIGRQVFLEMRVNITDVGSGLGGLNFFGIPFAPSSAVGTFNIGFGKNRATGNFVFVEIFNPGPNPSIGVSVATGLDVFATVLYTV